MRVLALEPWYGGSHRHHLDGLAAYSRHDFELVTMAARFWKWRMQGGAVTLARKATELVEGGYRPDVIWASSMVNVPAFLALTREHLADVPVVLYFHENQLTYPLPEGQPRDHTYGYINYLSGLAADLVAFNSQFHFDSFFEALPVQLGRFPDYTHLGTARRLRRKSRVLHLGLHLAEHDAHRRSSLHPDAHKQPLTVLWNQRWEHDKDPDAFFQTMNRLDDVGCRFRLILAGKHFEARPPAFERALERYAERVLHYGYAENFEEYSRLLHRADIVVSTARHEFFGISIMEAIYCGCHPVLPRRLSYPELIPETLHQPLLHAPVLYDDADERFALLRRLLTGEERPLPEATLHDVPAHLDWPRHVAAYDDLIEEAAALR